MALTSQSNGSGPRLKPTPGMAACDQVDRERNLAVRQHIPAGAMELRLIHRTQLDTVPAQPGGDPGQAVRAP